MALDHSLISLEVYRAFKDLAWQILEFFLLRSPAKQSLVSRVFVVIQAALAILCAVCISYRTACGP